MSGGVPPSSRAGRRAQVRPGERKDLSKARDLYERFSGHECDEGVRVRVKPLPKVAVNIGSADGILYTTVRDGKVEHYIHEFHKADKPIFAVSPDGKSLFFLGGRFDFTERGIVDRSDKSR